MNKKSTYKDKIKTDFDIKDVGVSSLNQLLEVGQKIGTPYHSFRMDKDWIKYPKDQEKFNIVDGESVYARNKRFCEHTRDFDVIFDVRIGNFLECVINDAETTIQGKNCLKKEYMIKGQYMMSSILKIQDIPIYYLKKLEELGAEYILPSKSVEKRNDISRNCSELLSMLKIGNIKTFEYLKNKLSFNILEDAHFHKSIMNVTSHLQLDFNSVEYLLNTENSNFLRGIIRDLPKELVQGYTKDLFRCIFQKIKQVNMGEKTEYQYRKIDDYQKLLVNLFDIMDCYDVKLKEALLGDIFFDLSRCEYYKELLLVLVDLEIIKDKACLNNYIYKGLLNSPVLQDDKLRAKGAQVNPPIDCFYGLSLGNYGVKVLDFMFELKAFDDVFNIENNDIFVEYFTHMSRLIAMNHHISTQGYSTMMNYFDWKLLDKESLSPVVNSLKLYDKIDVNNTTVYHQLFKEGFALEKKKLFNDLLREKPSLFELELENGKTLLDYAVIGAEVYASQKDLDVGDCISQVEKKMIVKLGDKKSKLTKPKRSFKM